MRKIFSLLICLSVVLALLLTFATAVYANPPILKDLNELPSEIYNKLQKSDLRAIASGKIPPPDFGIPESERDSEWVSPLPVTVHLRGIHGIPLSVAKPVKVAPTGISEEMSDRAKSQLDKITNDMVARYQSLPALRGCAKDVSNFEEYAEPGSGGVLQDFLFIDPEQMPTDPREAFGEKATVIPYDREKYPATASLSLSLKIRCLPSRVRVLGRGISRAEGLPALKNYDSDPYGDGKLSDTMRAKSQRLFDESGNNL